MKIEDCRIVELPRILDRRGNLSVIESGENVPFKIKRVYYLYDVPGGANRAGHAHKELLQLIIAMNGSFDIHLDDGLGGKRTFHLNRSYYGLLIPSLIWRDIDNFSTGSICMALASEHYSEKDYYRNYDEFKVIKKQLG